MYVSFQNLHSIRRARQKSRGICTCRCHILDTELYDVLVIFRLDGSDFLLEHIESGSTLIVCEVSRLSRSVLQFCEIMELVKEKHLRLEVLGSITVDCRSGEIDPMSAAFLQMASIFSELEKNILRSRVRSGMANAKAKGKQIGRRPTTKADLPAVFIKYYPAYANGSMNVTELARICGLSRPTVYKYIKMVG